MMRLARLVGAVGVLLGLGVCSAGAQSSVDSYFHEAAQQYVDGNQAAARRAVAEGLRTAPSDPRLLALRKKLEESDRPKDRQQQSSSSAQQSQQNSNQSSDTASKDKGKASQSSDQGASQSGQADRSDESAMAGQQSGSNEASRREAGRPDSLANSSSLSESTPEPERRGQGGSPRDTLSRAQAERLLQALEGQERRLLRELQTRSATQESVEKDW